jgi:hypothetical protein
MLRMDDTTPVFWTKNEDAITDPIDRDWQKYEQKYSGVGRRIAYDKFTTKEAVLVEYKRFLKATKGAKHRHIWIQGTLDGMGPSAMMKYLRGNA